MKQLIRRLSSSHYEPLRRRWSSSKKERRRSSSAVPSADGHVPVYVGEERQLERFEVRAELLSHPIFVELLRRSAQEFGYDQLGVIRIPCPVPVFERLVDYLMDSPQIPRDSAYPQIPDFALENLNLGN